MRRPAFVRGIYFTSCPGQHLTVMLLVLGGRVVATSSVHIAALRGGAHVKSQLRRALSAHALRFGPIWLGTKQADEITTVATKPRRAPCVG